MEQYISLLKKGCFTREEIAEMTGNFRTADSLLYYYKNKKYIESVKRNLYVAISPETGSPICNAFEIGCKIFPDAYISYHTAFEFHGLANQVFSDITVCSNSRFMPFEYDGRIYKYGGSGIDGGIITIGRVRVTDLERTIVDNIKSFSHNGGFEELLHCLALITYIDENRLLSYLKEYDNLFLYQKTGYLLSLYPNMKVSDEFFDICKRKTKKNVRYIYEDLKNEKSVFISEWSLYVPSNITALLGEGREIYA